MDHQGEARKLLREANEYVSETWPYQTGEHKADIIAAAQVRATLELAQQQKIANLIALGLVSLDVDGDGKPMVRTYTRARYGEFDPEISAALGIELGEVEQ